MGVHRVTPICRAYAHRVLDRPLEELLAEASRPASEAPARHLLAEGLHPADDALPRRLPLLHVRPAAARAASAPTSRADEVLAIARAGAAAGCHEALFTLGDKPELRYRAAREELAALGCETTIEYLARMCAARARRDRAAPARERRRADARRARARCATVDGLAGDDARDASDRLSERGGPHFGSPDKLPGAAARDARGRRRAARSRSRPGSWSASARPARSGSTRSWRSPRLPRAPRPRAGGDRPELPREAGHGDGRARPSRRSTSSSGRRAAARLVLPPERAPPGAAEPLLRRLPAPARRRDRRLGRRLAGDDRPREPRGAVAGARAAARGDRGGAASRSRRACPSTRSTSRPRALAASRASLPRGADARRDAGRPRARGRAGPPAPRRRSPFRCAGATRVGRSRRARRAVGERARRGRVATLCSPARGDELARASSPPPTSSAARRTATTSPTSSRGTSTTRTSALQVRLLRVLEGQARREPARRAVPPPARRDRRAARARRGSAARPRSASRAASTPASTATTTLESCAAVKDAAARHPRARLHRARGLAGRGDARRCRSPTTSRGCATPASRRCPGTAAEILDDEVRARPLPRQGHDRAVARGAPTPRTGRAALEHHDHVRPRRAAACTWARHLLARPRPAAGDGRLHRVRAAARSCTWRRRSTCKGRARRGPTFREALLMHAVARLALHPLDRRTSRPRG